jgi:putative ABC transport system permease protein
VARLGLTARALWWRRGASATLLAVATVTTTAAALGPVYARAAGESTLQDTLRQAPVDSTGLAFSTMSDVSMRQAVGDVNATLPAPGSLLGYPSRINEINASGSAQAVGGTGPVIARVDWRERDCAHLVLVAGRCPASPTEGIVSSRTLTGGYGIKLGSELQLDSVQVDKLGDTGAEVQVPAQVKVVGAYRPRDPSEDYWFGRNYFNAALYAGPGDGPDTIDTVFVDQSLFPTLSRPSELAVFADYPMEPRQLNLANEDEFQAGFVQMRLKYGPGTGTTLDTQVLGELATADSQRNLLDVSTILVTVQLALLAWLVLFQVMADAAESRGNEIALAKLRGLGPLATLRFGLGEPMALLVLAVPLGLVGAWIAVSVMAHVVLVPGTPVILNGAALLGALVGFAGGAVASALAARRTLTRPVLEQWRRVPQDHAPGLATLLLDVLVVAAAVGGLIALRHHARGGQPQAASLLGPGLLILAVALLGVRLLPFFGRAAFTPTRASKYVGSFLAVRQVVRRPAGMRLAALLAVAIGLATFAIDGEAVAAGNRTTRSSVEVGAAQVVDSQYQVNRSPLDIVRKVDPGGAWAMAAATWLPGGGPIAGEVIAVDSTRMVNVAYWPAVDATPAGGGVDAARAAELIGPPVPAPIAVTSGGLQVTVTGVSRGPGPAPILTAEVRPTGRKVQEIPLGPLQPGAHAYQAVVPCVAGCALVRVIIDRPIDFFGPMTGTLELNSLAQQRAGSWVPLDGHLTEPGQWRAAGDPASSDKLQPGPDGLTDTYLSTLGASPAMGHVDSPVPLPIIATPLALVRDGNAGPSIVQDITHTAAPYHEVGTVALVPVALAHGVLVDLKYIRAELPNFDNEAHWQVWLGPNAPANAVRQLAAAGLIVNGVHTQAQRQSELARQGTALALLLLVACAIAGAVLAAGATALAVAVTGRRRSFELAALRAVGVGRRVLLRSCVLEQMILLGAGLVLGLPTGIVAARLALPEIPEFSDVTPVPLDYSARVLAITVFALIVFGALVVTAVVAGRVLMRSAVPTRLREAAP